MSLGQMKISIFIFVHKKKQTSAQQLALHTDDIFLCPRC